MQSSTMDDSQTSHHMSAKHTHHINSFPHDFKTGMWANCAVQQHDILWQVNSELALRPRLVLLRV